MVCGDGADGNHHDGPGSDDLHPARVIHSGQRPSGGVL